MQGTFRKLMMINWLLRVEDCVEMEGPGEQEVVRTPGCCMGLWLPRKVGCGGPEILLDDYLASLTNNYLEGFGVGVTVKYLKCYLLWVCATSCLYFW